MSIPKALRADFKDKEYAHSYVDEFLNVNIATQIRVIREQQGLTQTQLADLSSMSQTRISVLENVNYSSWSINTLRKLAKAFDLTLRVSFESFGTRLGDIERLNRKALERTSRVDEISADERVEASIAAHRSKNFGSIRIATSDSSSEISHVQIQQDQLVPTGSPPASVWLAVPNTTNVQSLRSVTT